jgi:hypothetical protein
MVWGNGVLTKQMMGNEAIRELRFGPGNRIGPDARVIGLAYTTEVNSDHWIMIALDENKFFAFDPRNNKPVPLKGTSLKEAVIDFMDKHGHARIGHENDLGIAFSFFLPKGQEEQEEKDDEQAGMQ